MPLLLLMPVQQTAEVKVFASVQDLLAAAGWITVSLAMPAAEKQ
jgi:hypothetical protein